MALTLAFDVYGTLIDTHGVVEELHKLVGDKAEHFSHVWREKQLEYAFRRGLMQNYQPFAVCTRDALEYTCVALGCSLSEEQKQGLLKSYAALPAFADAADALRALSAGDHSLYAFSNGTADAVESLLTSAGLRDFFNGVVSVDDLRSFKPNPAVYSHFLRASGARGSDAWLVSSNPFDVIGAVSAGMRAAWVKRGASAVYDPWGIEPTVTVASLGELADSVGEVSR